MSFATYLIRSSGVILGCMIHVGSVYAGQVLDAKFGSLMPGHDYFVKKEVCVSARANGNYELSMHGMHDEGDHFNLKAVNGRATIPYEIKAGWAHESLKLMRPGVRTNFSHPSSNRGCNSSYYSKGVIQFTISSASLNGTIPAGKYCDSITFVLDAN